MMLAPPSSFSGGSSSSDGGAGRGSFSLSNSSSSHISISTTFNTNGGNNNNGPLKKFRIYFCKEMEGLAREIVRLDDRCVLGEIDWKHFPDSFPNLFIHNADSVKNYHVCFLANFHSPSVFFEQVRSVRCGSSIQLKACCSRVLRLILSLSSFFVS